MQLTLMSQYKEIDMADPQHGDPILDEELKQWIKIAAGLDVTKQDCTQRSGGTECHYTTHNGRTALNCT